MADNAHATSEDQRQPVDRRKAWWRLPVFLAMLMCLVFNLVLLLFQPLANVDPDSLPAAHTWTWWATKEYVEQKRAPDVVLLGSSLIMHCLSRADADLAGADIDYVKHHRSKLLEKDLAETGHVEQTVCYNFGLPGCVVSDDYMVLRALLKGDKKPPVVVLNLGVRDCIDNSVHCLATTPAFKYLKRYTNVDDLVDATMPQIFERSDYLIGKSVYLWGKKLDWQVVLAQQAQRALSPSYRRFFLPSRLQEADPERNMPSNARAEVEQGMFIVRHDEPYTWTDDSSAYRKRYRTANLKMFAKQEYFLRKLVELARDRQIEIVLVNMPVTDANHKLMPAGCYERYLAMLQQVGREYGCPFLDLDRSGLFTRYDFYDTVHMNGAGGKKFAQALATFLSNQKSVLAAMSGKDPGALATRQVHSPQQY